MCFNQIHPLLSPLQLLSYTATSPFQVYVLLFFNSLSPHGAANLCMGIGPTTGAWATYQESHLKKTSLQSPAR